MTATGVACAACGAELHDGSKFCHECGAAVALATQTGGSGSSDGHRFAGVA
jgi:hypothetical protein